MRKEIVGVGIVLMIVGVVFAIIGTETKTEEWDIWEDGAHSWGTREVTQTTFWGLVLGGGSLLVGLIVFIIGVKKRSPHAPTV